MPYVNPLSINSETVTSENSSFSKENSFSGLPTVHVKANQQHRFISRKSVKPKLHKTLSLPDALLSESPDLIQTPFEDIVRQRGKVLPDISQRNSSMSPITETKVHTQVDSDEEIVMKLDVQNTSDRRYMSRQISDALIIPDPFGELRLEMENILV